LSFGTTSTYHRKISNKKAVLRSLPRDCLKYLTDYWPCTEKRAFMQKLSCSGHTEYSVVLASQILQSGRPDLIEINFILRKASEHGSDEARYFMMMLLALSKDGSLVGDAFFTFKDLFNRRQLAKCKEAIMNVGGLPHFWGHFWTRPLLPEFVYRFICTSNHTCQGHERKSGIYWPFPSSDNDYLLTNICLFCHFDIEILVQLCFLEPEGY